MVATQDHATLTDTDTDAWAALVAEIAELRSQMLDLREWLGAVASDMLDRTTT